jgi:hypothetical protein
VYMSDLGGVLLRRWYLALVGLLATAGLIALAVHAVPPKYEATADVLLLPPKTTNGANPYLLLGGLQSAADVVSRAMMDTDTVRTVEIAAGSRKYVVEPDHTTSGPVLLITVTESSPAVAAKVRKIVIDQVPVTLLALQAASNVQPSFRITDQLITKDDPTAYRSSQYRAVLIAAGFGIFGTLLFSALVDSFILRRRKDEAPEPPAPPSVNGRFIGDVPGIRIEPSPAPAKRRRRWASQDSDADLSPPPRSRRRAR